MKAAKVLSCGAVTTTATTAKEALATEEEEPDEFPDITSAEERDAISVVVTECEHEKRVEAWIAADEAVMEGAANFKKNGGFERGTKVDNGESNADIMASLH